jgi:hypothetical protein
MAHRRQTALLVAAGASIEPEWLERERVRDVHKCSWPWAARIAQLPLAPLARVWREVS